MSYKDAVKFHNVKDADVIRDWENGEKTVPVKAWQQIAALGEYINNAVMAAVKQYEISKNAHDNLAVIRIVRYNEETENYIQIPVSVHQTAINMIKLELEYRGEKVEIVDFDPESYFDFIKKQKLNDTPTSRSAWANFVN